MITQAREECRECEQCGVEFERKSMLGPAPKYCSKECGWKKARSERVRGHKTPPTVQACAVCGDDYISELSARTCCSKACGLIQRQRTKVERGIRQLPQVECKWCGRTFGAKMLGDNDGGVRLPACCSVDCGHKHRHDPDKSKWLLKARCDHGPWSRIPGRDCDVCGEWIWRPGMNLSCSPECRGFKARDRIRARKRIVGSSAQVAIYRSEILERDNWKCGICGGEISPDLAWPDRMSATLDHIVPIVKGGDHSFANVQAAHFTCNSSKGDRRSGSQTRLW